MARGDGDRSSYFGRAVCVRTSRIKSTGERHRSTIFMRLLHLTNYWGTMIDTAICDPDSELGFHALWVQALEDGQEPCCRGHGRRAVEVSESDLEGFHRGRWNLWKVSGTRGRNEDHYFYKMALVPQGLYGKGKKTLLRKGWKLIDEGIDSWYMLRHLEQVLDDYWEDGSDDFNHVHIGIDLSEVHHKFICDDGSVGW